MTDQEQAPGKTWINFDLRFVVQDHHCRIVASAESFGEESETVGLRELLAIGEGPAGSTLDELKARGKKFFDRVFSGSILRLFEHTRQSLKLPSGESGVLVVRIRSAELSPLQSLPWEIIFDGERFLATDPGTPVVRCFDQGRHLQTLTISGPLRVLFTWANPGSTMPLTVKAEIDALKRVYGKRAKNVKADIGNQVTRTGLAKLFTNARMKGEPYHIWHHCGHGRIEKESFELGLEGRGEADWVNIDALNEIVTACPELRIAVLNTCHSATSSRGLAATLAVLQVPIVVGFRHRVLDALAFDFAAAFHEGLFFAQPEVALNLARKRLKVKDDGQGWFDAVIYARRWGNDRLLPVPKSPAATPDTNSGSAPGGVRINATGNVAGRDVIVTGVRQVGRQEPSIPPGGIDIEAHDNRGVQNILITGAESIGPDRPALDEYEKGLRKILADLTRDLERCRP